MTSVHWKTEGSVHLGEVREEKGEMSLGIPPPSLLTWSTGVSGGILARYPLHCLRTEVQGSRGMLNAVLNQRTSWSGGMELVNSITHCSMEGAGMREEGGREEGREGGREGGWRGVGRKEREDTQDRRPVHLLS